MISMIRWMCVVISRVSTYASSVCHYFVSDYFGCMPSWQSSQHFWFLLPHLFGALYGSLVVHNQREQFLIQLLLLCPSLLATGGGPRGRGKEFQNILVPASNSTMRSKGRKQNQKHSRGVKKSWVSFIQNVRQRQKHGSTRQGNLRS